MTRTPATTPTTTTTTAATDAALKDMAYVLKLTGKIAADIRGDKPTIRKPRANAAV